MPNRFLILPVATVLFGCDRAADTHGAGNAVPEAIGNEAAPLTPPAPGTVGGLPDDRTPLAEPEGPIDPKSAEAAGQVMQHYGALIEQGRLSEAAALWGDAVNAAKFAAQFANYSEAHAQVGKPGDMEGAAGSIYVTVPFALYGRLKSGGEFTRSGSAILRRANDVPGSTQRQRRWHIERIELGGTD